MTASPMEIEQRTIETRLQWSPEFDLLDSVLAFFAKARHKLWRDLIIKELSINELKSSYIKDGGLTARQFNSLAKDVSGMAKSLEELKKDNLKGLNGRIAAQKQSIHKLNKKLKTIKSSLSAIATYRAKIAAWKTKALNCKRPCKKPPMPLSIKEKFKERLVNELSELNFAIHQKKRRLGILEEKLRRIQSQPKPSLCFGSKRLFSRQFNLISNEYESHEDWLADFQLSRSSRMTFVGSSDESCANQTVQYTSSTQSLRFRLPNASEFQSKGKYLELEGVVFPEFLREEFFDALSAPTLGAKKSQKTKLPVTYRFVRRVNENTGERSYYLQASFGIKAAEIVTVESSGMIAVDLNADHLAVCETDRFGNWIDSYILPFDLRGLSSPQAEAIICDLCSVVMEDAKKKAKPVALEELDFSKKKMALRLLPRSRRKGLSQFAYSRFIQAMQSRARREGIVLHPVNPAYTSLIGAYKYQGLKISSHEKAALAIARRAQGYTEELEVFQGTLPSQVMMTEKTKFRETSRHTWGFYSDNQKQIRKLFIEDDRRPLLPIKRAISLARNKTSLEKSLIVTREKRALDELCRSTG